MSAVATIQDTIPEPCNVFGTVLRPFSLGHHLLLTKCGLPFASSPHASCSPDELIVAVAICAATFAETTDSMLRDEWVADVSRWLDKLKPGWFKPKFQLPLELAKFRRYLEDGYGSAPVWRHDTPHGIKLTAPWELVLKCRLVNAGFRECDVLEKYLPAAWYDFFTVTEFEQAANCTDHKKWRKVFFTEQDREALNAAPS